MRNGIALPRVVIADDTVKMRQLISRIVRPQCRVVGFASDGPSALEAVIRHRPDLVLLDVFMPNLDGIQVARQLQTLGTACKIIIVTILEDRGYVNAAFTVGATGYVFKRRIVKDLPHAIREVMAGRLFVSDHSSRDSGPNHAV